MNNPTLITVTGPAATGKTTLAKGLGELLSLPTICKDDIKEALFDTLGYETIEWVEKLEVATNELLFFTAENILKSAKSLIVETDISSQSTADRIKDLKQVYDFNTLQIACHTDGDVLVERFKQRAKAGGRHPGHYEMYYLETCEEFRDSLKKGFGETLDLAGGVIMVDTTNFAGVDYKQLASQIAAQYIV